MTYCIAAALEEGLVFVSDSRTNAGIDQVSTYSKMHTFGIDGERQFVMLSAGNLATTQAVITQIRRHIEKNTKGNLYTFSHLSEAAEYLGRINRQQQRKHSADVQAGGFNPQATFILGGQITAEAPEVYMVYAQGNYITTSKQTPFLQLGEGKYGKPILDRILTPQTDLEEAARCCLVSMDSTMRSNASVGPPIELLIYKKNWLRLDKYRQFEADEPCLLDLRRAWDKRIMAAFKDLPPIECSMGAP